MTARAARRTAPREGASGMEPAIDPDRCRRPAARESAHCNAMTRRTKMDRTTEDEVTHRLRDATESAAQAHESSHRAGRQTLSAIEEEWRRLKHDLSELAGNHSLAHNPEIEALMGRLREGVARASDVISETSRHTSDRVSRVAADADDYVHESPWKVISIAAVVGIAVGLMMRRH
jgi:ElaB/YqjD/DUF883 family membrane-anchored ribosome-binding protein